MRTPYTVRGPQRDDADFRAQSLARLIELLSDKLPPVLFVENVFAFLQSTMHARLLRRLAVLGYNLREETMCPTRFGIPMKRPRIFLTAVREGIRFADLANPDGQPQPMSGFIEEQRNDKLVVSDESFARYREGMHIIDPHDPNAYAICFTSGYGKSFKSSGSLLQQDNVVRHFSPREILSLMGFESDFRFPPDMDLRTCWRLVGNSVDIRCIRRVLGSVERKSNWVKSQHDSSTHR
jgi:DNA (cytosine-5)-methyltransferase 1